MGGERSYDKSTAQMARYFYHDKFPLETCISNATSHFITKWHKKSRMKVATFFLIFYGRWKMNVVRGYFDGNICVPVEKADFGLNEEVLIMPLKKRTKTSEIIDRYFGVLDDSSTKAAVEAMENCRKVEADEWKSF